MRELTLIGIGTGNPDHLTAQAAKAINAADLVLVPRKGPDKADLADLRRTICEQHLTAQTRVVEFDLPVRDASTPDYLDGVNDWHDAIAAVWAALLTSHLPKGGRAALMATHPFTAFSFAVEIVRADAGAPLAGAAFSECDGLEIGMEVKTIREGGQFRHADLVQVGTENDRMQRELRDLGVDFYKMHRVYKKDLGPACNS